MKRAALLSKNMPVILPSATASSSGVTMNRATGFLEKRSSSSPKSEADVRLRTVATLKMSMPPSMVDRTDPRSFDGVRDSEASSVMTRAG